MSLALVPGVLSSGFADLGRFFFGSAAHLG